MASKRTEYVRRYEQRNITRMLFKFNTERDREVIERIRKQSNMTDYIRQLVTKDINRDTQIKELVKDINGYG